jgi:hypothetical protein
MKEKEKERSLQQMIRNGYIMGGLVGFFEFCWVAVFFLDHFPSTFHISTTGVKRKKFP